MTDNPLSLNLRFSLCLRWALQPRNVDATQRLDDPQALTPGFNSLVISSLEKTKMTRQATVTSNALGGQLTLNQV